MSDKKKKPHVRSWTEVNQSLRRDWGLVKPYTRVEEDKRKRKPKHKNRCETEDE